jgi:hypothetical protein
LDRPSRAVDSSRLTSGCPSLSFFTGPQTRQWPQTRR